tara:strand:+ start:589 stop:768 length:180 start_codon:yes stop_codon:yes gene_type:complete
MATALVEAIGQDPVATELTLRRKRGRQQTNQLLSGFKAFTFHPNKAGRQPNGLFAERET